MVSLQVNKQKSTIHMVGGDDQTRSLMEITRLHEGTMPFKCVGVSLASEKLITSYYNPLLDSIIRRINLWPKKFMQGSSNSLPQSSKRLNASGYSFFRYHRGLLIESMAYAGASCGQPRIHQSLRLSCVNQRWREDKDWETWRHGIKYCSPKYCDTSKTNKILYGLNEYIILTWVERTSGFGRWSTMTLHWSRRSYLDTGWDGYFSQLLRGCCTVLNELVWARSS